MIVLSTVATFFTLVAASCAAPRVEGNCTYTDAGLEWLRSRLSNRSAISCLGQPLQQYNANRYWGTQFGKNASVVVFPGTTQDVSYAVQAANQSPLGEDFAFVGGAHSQTNASSAYGFVLDLAWLNSSSVIHDFEFGGNNTVTAIEYEGGANWGQVQAVTNGTGFTAVGARVANVGVGGFSLGGGIGFLAGAYGYASDRLVQLEVVLPSGETVIARKNNEYADLFWALQGGIGQFGIVTRFWQEAAPEPKKSSLGFYYINDEDVPRLRNQTVDFFNNNEDPFSVIYYSFGFLPANLANPTPESYAKRTLLITVHFEDPNNADQLDNELSFATLFDGVDTTNGQVITTEYYSDLAFVGEAAYPYGFRRGFYGPQTTKIDVDYITNVTDSFYAYIDELQNRGEDPQSASFIIQYMFPGCNGHLPKSNFDTAWPHAVSGHQTLFTPAYLQASNDGLTLSALAAANQITYDKQQELGEFLGDYPNYLCPVDNSGRRVWGENMEKLIEVKQKYDPECLIRNGPVLASQGCLSGGWGNMFDH
ncbi:hypothetical protein K4F52_007204 [Lecanicillium sp. MT-2017a]|nr:hypothetical protein K4F52_007204 [Lecanicillium sp. MT-2017a]